MRKALVTLLAGAMALLLSGCFSLQGFSVLRSSIAPRRSTKVQFVMHPSTNVASRQFQFVVVGVDSDQLSVGKATWGTNHRFGGPKVMRRVNGFGVVMFISGTCAQNGISFSSITGMNWTGFLTQHKVKDKGAVGQKLITQVALKAKKSATHGVPHFVTGVTGVYVDDGDGVFNAADTFQCTGISTSSVFVT